MRFRIAFVFLCLSMSTRFSLSHRLSFLSFLSCAVLLQSAVGFAAPEPAETSPSSQSAVESAALTTGETAMPDTASVAKTVADAVTGTLFPTLPSVPNIPATPTSVAAPQTQNRVLDAPVQELDGANSLFSIATRLNLPLPLPKARIVVLKSRRRLELWNEGQLVKTYQVALGGNPLGAKTRQHDNRTPEGNFTICTRNATTSAFHIFLGLSYPGLPDAARGVNRGTITWREYALIQRQLASRNAPPWETRMGGWVGIHGGTGGQFAQKQSLKRGRSDWTAGCVALTDSEIEELYAATKIGTPVWIRP
ncbi:MAG TPA: L,D-transpeptidase [Abditibacteriaceae bacterium]|nr:L,D-transpeptidase [Abditibacteriaceae bacterium]